MAMNITTILADSYDFFSGNFRQIAGLFLPMLLGVTLLEHVIMATVTTAPLFWAVLAGMLLYPLYTGAMILLLTRRTQHETPGNGQLLRAALTLWWPLVVLTFIASAVVFSGLLLLIIPGIWVAVRLAFAEIYVVVEGLMPLAAMRKSHDTTKELFWVILLAVACVYAPLIMLSYLSQWMMETYEDGSVLGVITDTVVAFLGLFVNVVIFRIYLLKGMSRSKD
jgi:hypothetical protein